MREIIPRAHNRINVPLSVTIDAASAHSESRISDLSMGGCYVDSLHFVRPDENVHLVLSLYGKQAGFWGNVVYVHDGIGFGVKFSDLNYEQRETLEQIILLNGGKL